METSNEMRLFYRRKLKKTEVNLLVKMFWDGATDLEIARVINIRRPRVEKIRYDMGLRRALVKDVDMKGDNNG